MVKKVIVAIERLRDRIRLATNIKDLLSQELEAARQLLELLEQPGGIDKLKSLFNIK